MGEERKWEERKWRGKKSGEKMLSFIMLGWMRENRKEGKWVGEVGHDYWTMLSNFSLSYNPPILGGKWGMWLTHFSSPLFFPLSFSPHPSKGKYFPHPIFLSHFLSSLIFPPSKHTLIVYINLVPIFKRRSFDPSSLILFKQMIFIV